MTAYTIKTWNSDNGKPTIRHGMLWGVAWAIATKAGYAKVQVICEEFGTVELETKS